MTSDTVQGITPQEVEQFLYREARLLDEWRLDEWLNLMTDDIGYYVPATDTPSGDPRKVLSLIADNATWLRSRVEQLMGRLAWAENPRSRTRRLISNVEIVERESDSLHVAANFVVFRTRFEVTDMYVGRYDYKFVRQNGQLKIRERRATLDLDSLRPHGKISFIL